MVKCSASILSADWLKLGDEIKRVDEAKCDCIHIDITDGHFVPNLTMGLDITQAVGRCTNLRKDVHLMISNPETFIKKFSNIGGDLIIFHAESTKHPFEMIKYIKDCGKLIGVALDPATRIEEIEHYLYAVDVVLIVAVCVGFGGQSYIEEIDEKIKRLVKVRKEKGLEFEIQVDGGITPENSKQKLSIGVDTLFAGSMFFLSDDVEKLVKEIKK